MFLPFDLFEQRFDILTLLKLVVENETIILETETGEEQIAFSDIVKASTYFEW